MSKEFGFKIENMPPEVAFGGAGGGRGRQFRTIQAFLPPHGGLSYVATATDGTAWVLDDFSEEWRQLPSLPDRSS